MGRNGARLLAVLVVLLAVPDAALGKVLPRSPWAGKARASIAERLYVTPSGAGVQVAVSPSYVAQPDIAQSYAEFLDSLPHGDEIRTLNVYIAPPREISDLCGDDALACYTPDGYRMFVPGEELDASTGLEARYVVAHEYGHHIAASRSNAPLDALAYGPKRWASYERVCSAAAEGFLAPGDQGLRYQENPGEAWAETYAQLQYPGVRWYYAASLAPDEGAFGAALADVVEPWTAEQSQTFTGRIRRARSKRFQVPVSLDGTVSVQLDGPSRAQFDLRVSSGRKVLGRTRVRGSDDSLELRSFCRRSATERLDVTVVRRSGSGPFSLTVRYAG
jgi:hypothetical protein